MLLQPICKRFNSGDTLYSSELSKRTLKCTAGEEVPVFFPNCIKHGIELYIPLLYKNIVPATYVATNVFKILSGSCISVANRVLIGSKYYLGYAGFIMEENEYEEYKDLKTNEIAALVQSRIQACMDGVLK